LLLAHSLPRRVVEFHRHEQPHRVIDYASASAAAC
jgi:hypothetical protein